MKVLAFFTITAMRTLWAVIQTEASDIDFDYAAYAAELFEAYRRAREELRGSR